MNVNLEKFRAWDAGRGVMLVNHTFKTICETGMASWEGLIWMRPSGVDDMHGDEIYEGDILYCKEEDCKGSVVFESGAFVTEASGFGWNPLWGDELDYERIGNIYENPELLDQ